MFIVRVVPVTAVIVWLLAVPELVSGFVAGLIVTGGWNGALTGGLATVFGGLVWLALVPIVEGPFVRLFPAISVADICLLVLFVPASPARWPALWAAGGRHIGKIGRSRPG